LLDYEGLPFFYLDALDTSHLAIDFPLSRSKGVSNWWKDVNGDHFIFLTSNSSSNDSLQVDDKSPKDDALISNLASSNFMDSNPPLFFGMVSYGHVDTSPYVSPFLQALSNDVWSCQHSGYGSNTLTKMISPLSTPCGGNISDNISWTIVPQYSRDHS